MGKRVDEFLNEHFYGSAEDVRENGAFDSTHQKWITFADQLEEEIEIERSSSEFVERATNPKFDEVMTRYWELKEDGKIRTAESYLIDALKNTFPKADSWDRMLEELILDYSIPDSDISKSGLEMVRNLKTRNSNLGEHINEFRNDNDRLRILVRDLEQGKTIQLVPSGSGDNAEIKVLRNALKGLMEAFKADSDGVVEYKAEWSDAQEALNYWGREEVQTNETFSG